MSISAIHLRLCRLAAAILTFFSLAGLAAQSELTVLRPYSLEFAMTGSYSANNTINENYSQTGAVLKMTGRVSSYNSGTQNWSGGWESLLLRRLDGVFLAGLSLHYSVQLPSSLELTRDGETSTLQWTFEEFSPSASLLVELFRKPGWVSRVRLRMGYVYSNLRYGERVGSRARVSGLLLNGHGLQMAVSHRFMLRLDRRSYLFADTGAGFTSVFGYSGKDSQGRPGSLYSITREAGTKSYRLLQFIPDDRTASLERDLKDAEESGLFIPSVIFGIGAGRNF